MYSVITEDTPANLSAFVLVDKTICKACNEFVLSVDETDRYLDDDGRPYYYLTCKHSNACDRILKRKEND